jgi:hypothetical protein
LNELATEGNSADCGGRVLNVHAGSGTTSYLRDGMRNGADLGPELRASRRLPFEDGNENGQCIGLDVRSVFGVLVAPEQAETNPGLARRRLEHATDGFRKRPRKILLERAICFGDKFYCNDWHAG